MLEEIKSKIESDKEVLSTLPQNNIRNRKKYKQHLHEVVEKYQKIRDAAYIEIEARYHKLNKEYKDKNKQDYSEILNNIMLFNEYQTSFEILKLDRILNNINNFEENKLDIVNDSIKEVLNIFESAGIKLKGEDFNFNIYASNYIDNISNNNQSSQEILKYFESLYWKCPNILRYITLNIYNLYFKNKKKFDKYVSLKRKEIMNNNGTLENLINTYYDEKIKNAEIKNHDYTLYLDDFKKGLLDLKDFQFDKIENGVKEIASNAIVPDKKKLFFDLLNSLKEYQAINSLKYIVKDLHDLLEEKNDFKNIVSKELKEISKIESNIIKNNCKAQKLIRKGHENETGVLLNQNDTLLDSLQELYNNLPMDKVKENIYLFVNENSNINTYYKIAIANYLYLVDLNNKANIELTIEETEKKILKLIYNPYNILVDNVTFNDLDKLDSIIVDKYKLLGVSISNDVMGEGSVEGFTNNIKNIVRYNNMMETKVNFENVDFILKAEKIIEVKKNV